jgi:hypothetical protein
MMVSFGAIGASAAFTDTADSVYGEAISVMNGIGVIDGMTGTTFEPTGNLTREQAAKIIAYMLLGPTNAQLISTASSQKFSDVAKTRWSAGYIEYCANLGIISGVGGGKFDPAGSLTTAAWSKMLLCALGYKADTEGLTGDSWAINAATLAVGAGISDSRITVSALTPCTREQACQLAYKTLTATTVSYTGGTSITIDGKTIVTGATRNFVPNGSGTGYLSAGNDTQMQFCEAKFPSLKQTTGSGDKYGHPSYVWKNGITTIGTFGSKPAVATWTDDHTVTASDNTVAKALAGYTYAAGSGSLYENGVLTPNQTFTAAAIAAMTGNGVKVEVYATAGVIDRVVVTTTVLATIINKDTYNKTVTVSDGTNSVTLRETSDADFFGDAYSALYAKNVKDKVLLVATTNAGAINGILSYADPTVVTGNLTSISGSSYTFSGTVYKYNKVVSGGAKVDSSDLGQSFSLTLDTYGYILATSQDASATTYAFMVQGSRDGSAMSGYTYYAQLLFGDGSMKWAEFTSWGGSTISADLATGAAVANKFVSFVENADGTYALSDASAGQDTITAKTITKNDISFNSENVSNTTVFLIYNSAEKTYTAYTGIANVPTTGVATGYGFDNAGTAYKMVVVTVVGGTPGSDAFYVYDATSISSELVGTVTVNTYKAVVNGVMTTVKAKDGEITGVGMYIGNAYTNDYVSDVGSDTATGIGATDTEVFGVTDRGVSKTAALTAKDVTLSDGILTVNNATSGTITGVVSEDFVCYTINTSTNPKTCTVMSLGSTATAVSGTMYFAVNANGYITYAILVVA